MNTSETLKLLKRNLETIQAYSNVPEMVNALSSNSIHIVEGMAEELTSRSFEQGIISILNNDVPSVLGNPPGHSESQNEAVASAIETVKQQLASMSQEHHPDTVLITSNMELVSALAAQKLTNMYPHICFKF